MSIEDNTKTIPRPEVLLNDDDVIPIEGPDQSDPDKYHQDLAPDSSIHYNLRTLSYSALLTLHGCPRKYELHRLIPRHIDVERDEDSGGHMDFGTVVGNGIQELLVSKNLDRAMFRAFIDWKDNLESDRGLKAKKTFWHAIQAISKFTEIINGPLSQYELAYYQGKPAIELGFSIDCGDGFTYRGKLDALLIHKTKREFLPLECKTTGWKYLDEAMYGNSSQGIGYGVVIDRVAHEMNVEYNSYDVLYPVYMTSKSEWVPFRFHKSNTARALWLQDILLDVSHIQQYSELGYFQKRGESCFSYGRQCQHYGQCHLANELIVGDMKYVPVRLDKKEAFPLRFSIDELIEAQVFKDVDKVNEENKKLEEQE